MGGSGAFLLSDRPFDARAFDIDTNALSSRMGVRVGDKKVPVSTADFAHHVAGSFGLRENFRQGVTQGCLSLLHGGQKPMRAGKVFHGERTKALRWRKGI